MEAQTVFILIVFTATIPGVIVGSITADRYGGYKGKGMMNALSLCCVYSAFASIFSLLLTITFDETGFIVFMWLFFFFGACIMPIGIGVIIGCVPKYAHNSASAVYGILFNVFGLSLSPSVAAHIMEQYSSKREGMIHGYRILLYAGPFLLVFFIIARLIIASHISKLYKQARQKKIDNNLINIEEALEENDSNDIPQS